MTTRSLEDKIKHHGDAQQMLRSSQTGKYEFPVKPEWSNWRKEQEAWATTAVLFDQSVHMTDTFIEGPDMLKLLSDISVNNISKFKPMMAIQLVACRSDGYMISDAIAFYHADNRISIVGRPALPNYVEFMAQSGGYDVKVTKDARALENKSARKTYRFQIQGPTADKIFEKVNGGPMPEIPFFRMGDFNIGKYRATALNHRMTGAPGLEFWGPAEDKDAVRELLLKEGAEFGLVPGGGLSYGTSGHESGWLGAVLPAIYDGDEMKNYREWLPADGFEAMYSLGGSLVTEDLRDAYFTPWDLGYNRLIHWDHEFIGREALMQMREQENRKKVWLKWNDEDVLKVMASMFSKDMRFKQLDMPMAQYATTMLDQLTQDGEDIGLSSYASYTSNVRGWFSFGVIKESQAIFGNEAELLWGEPDGGSSKPTVEPHLQTSIRATISKTAFG